MDNGQLVIADSQDGLLEQAAHRWQEAAQHAISARGHFHVALSGGRTPAALYHYLSQLPALTSMWPHTSVYFGDERCVPPDHVDSNYAMVKRQLLDPLSDNAPTCFRIEGEKPPELAARDYAEQLDRQLPHVNDWPCFDLVLLGMGADGHTASLFPGTQGLQEQQERVIANFVPQLDSWRISMTFPVLTHAAELLVLVTGDEKAEVLAQVLQQKNHDYPINNILGHAKLTWLVDQAAARHTG